MNTSSRWPVYCVLLLALAGCARMEARSSSAPAVMISPPAAARSEYELLAYAHRYGGLSAEEQKREQAAVALSLNRDKGDLTARMKAALMYGLPSSRIRDNARALALLDEIQRDMTADANIKALAALLRDYIAERQKLEENAARLGQKAADEQKRADSLQQKAEGLQQKLDELKNIEKALTERNQTKPK